jgi:NAD(P)H dehydrogenase (quinone)
MILITGASGKTGRAVLSALAKRGESVRIFVHRADQADTFKLSTTLEAVYGDLHDDGALEKAMQGVQKIYHICPNVQPDEVEIGEKVIRAARAAGVSHIVYHSVLHPQVEEMPHHWKKMRVEEQLFKSGIGYTMMQPVAYMQNTLAQWNAITQKGVYPVPYAETTCLGMVDLEDVAEAAAIVLTEPGHQGGTYELAGMEALTQTEVAQVFSRVIGRPVQVQVVPKDEWEKNARASGMQDYAVTTLLKMFNYYEQYGFWGNSTVLAALLCREPVTFEQFVTRVKQR